MTLRSRVNGIQGNSKVALTVPGIHVEQAQTELEIRIGVLIARDCRAPLSLPRGKANDKGYDAPSCISGIPTFGTVSCKSSQSIVIDVRADIGLKILLYLLKLLRDV